MKKLVVYYSLSGNTRAVARRIARTLRADLMAIRTVKSYPDDYDVLLSLGQKEIKSGYMPQIEPLAFDANRPSCSARPSGGAAMRPPSKNSCPA